MILTERAAARSRLLGFVICSMVLPMPLMAEELSADTGSSRGNMLVDEIARIAKAAEGTVGVSLLHLESGESVSFNGEQRFPLASTYKIPIAAYALHLVETGKLGLSMMIELEASERVVSSVINTAFPHPGVALSLGNLLEVMLTESDNTATDLVLARVGGPAQVTAWLRDNEIHELRVDRSTAELLRDYAGVGPPEPGESYSDQFERLVSDGRLDVFSQDGSSDSYIRFVRDPRDQGTPDEMTGLLGMLWRRELLTDQSVNWLEGAMRRCRTGTERIPARLPLGTEVAHKSGTITGTVNDVGLIKLPSGKGHVLLSIYIKHGTDSRASLESAIADIARAAYDYFVFRYGS